MLNFISIAQEEFIIPLKLFPDNLYNYLSLNILKSHGHCDLINVYYKFTKYTHIVKNSIDLG